MSNRSFFTAVVRVGLAPLIGLSLAACEMEAAEVDTDAEAPTAGHADDLASDTAPLSSELAALDDPSVTTTVDAATAATSGCSIDGAHTGTSEGANCIEGRLYCHGVYYKTFVRYWAAGGQYNFGSIEAQQFNRYASSTREEGIDYKVQIKSVHDDYHVWWSRGPSTSSSWYLLWHDSSTPASWFPGSWKMYVRFELGKDGDGYGNCVAYTRFY